MKFAGPLQMSLMFLLLRFHLQFNPRHMLRTFESWLFNINSHVMRMYQFRMTTLGIVTLDCAQRIIHIDKEILGSIQGHVKGRLPLPNPTIDLDMNGMVKISMHASGFVEKGLDTGLDQWKIHGSVFFLKEK
jgi:hypothetical protein